MTKPGLQTQSHIKAPFMGALILLSNLGNLYKNYVLLQPAVLKRCICVALYRTLCLKPIEIDLIYWFQSTDSTHCRVLKLI